MKLLWDERKRKSNLEKHGFDFLDAEIVFTGPIFTILDDRFEYGEERFITLGMLRERVVVIVHTESSETTRIISLRKATKNEQEIYFKGLTDELGTD